MYKFNNWDFENESDEAEGDEKGFQKVGSMTVDEHSQ